VLERFRADEDVAAHLGELETAVAEGRVSPSRAAQDLLGVYSPDS
jgi:hypothetical protein